MHDDLLRLSMSSAIMHLSRIFFFDEMGGAVSAVDSSYMKNRLVESNAKRLAAIEAGDQVVVGGDLVAD